MQNDTLCYGNPENFTNASSGATGWNWLFGDGQTSNQQNAIHLYADTGTYHIKLVAYNNGCSDTSLAKSLVVLAPKAIFSYSLNCSNYFQVQFSSQSEGADSLVWNFGDGSLDTLNHAHPSHVYLLSGPITVSLSAYNYKTHCINTVTESFTLAKPIASFSVNAMHACYPFTAQFTSTSQDAHTFYWNFGDPASTGDTAHLANPNYTYLQPGLDIVQLLITDVNGCVSTKTDTLKTLGPLPYFYASDLKGCRPLKLVFADTSHSDSTLVQWKWNFGDGSALATTVNSVMSHTYTSPGIYSVSMLVTDKNGCTDSISKLNYIQVTFPYPAFTADTFSCRGNLMTFNAAATQAVGPKYYWNFGDGTVDSTYAGSITHSYSSDNLYTVSLTVIDTNGCDSTLKQNIRILKPTASFTWSVVNTGCGNMQVKFTDLSVGFPSAWIWDFGNGATSQVQNPSYTYTQPGIYNVSLIVMNPGGCSDTLKQNGIIVVPGPIGTFSFSPMSGCNPLLVTFLANSQNAQFYTWDFGDGTVIQFNTSIINRDNLTLSLPWEMWFLQEPVRCLQAT